MMRSARRMPRPAHGRPTLLVLAAILSATSALTARALTAEEPLPMRYETAPDRSPRPDGPMTTAPAVLTNACTVNVVAVDDLRRSPQVVGNITLLLPTMLATPRAVHSIRGGDGRQWTQDALKAMVRHGFQARFGDAPPTRTTTGRATIAVSLKLAHAWSAGLSLASHVALEVRFIDAGTSEVRRYHGIGAKGNWNNGNGEYMDVLNAGMDEAILALERDLAAVCSNRPLSAQAVRAGTGQADATRAKPGVAAAPAPASAPVPTPIASAPPTALPRPAAATAINQVPAPPLTSEPATATRTLANMPVVPSPAVQAAAMPAPAAVFPAEPSAAALAANPSTAPVAAPLPPARAAEAPPFANTRIEDLRQLLQPAQ